MIINLLRIIELLDNVSKVILLDETEKKYEKISLHLDEIMHKLDLLELEIKSKNQTKE